VTNICIGRSPLDWHDRASVGHRIDPIEVVEACYDLRASEPEWLERVGRGLNAVGPSEGRGLIGYHVDLSDGGPRIRNPVHVEDHNGVIERIRYMADLLERRRAGKAGTFETLQAALYEKVIAFGLRTPADRMLMSEIDKVGPDWMYTLGVPGVRDHWMSINHHIDGLGATLFVRGLGKRPVLRAAERQMFQMLSAHIKAGLRLRRRLGARALDRVELPRDGAVLDASAHVVEAAGEASDAEARNELREQARLIDRARAAHGGRDPEALEVWRGLVSGRWSLVEQFDSDGKRFLLAHRNPEEVRDPRGLTPMESRVTGLAVRGYSDKLIAYHLGVSEGTASAHLHRALQKLGMANRVELVRLLGTHYPQPTDRRFQ